MAKEIHIEGGISENWNEMVNDLAGATDVTIYLYSGGGVVFEGLAMADAIKRHSATNKVEIIGTGIVASIATMVLLSASEGCAKMTENSFFMIHRATWGLEGDAEQLRKAADTLEKMEGRLSEMYLDAIRSNGKLINGSEEDTRAQITAWMGQETWFTAKEALAVGLIDAIVSAKDYSIGAMKNAIKNCTNVPDAIKNKLNAMEINEQEKTLFQKIQAWFGLTPKAEIKPEEQEQPVNIETSIENMTPEQLQEWADANGYELKKKEEEMTEEEVMAAAKAAGMEMVKKTEAPVTAEATATPENKAPENSAELTALKAKLEAQQEELARLKQANNRVKVTEQPKTTQGLSRKEAAIERALAENKTKFEEMANGLKKRMG